MSIKSLIAVSMVLMVAGCSENHQKGYGSFDEYPVYEGEWNEMTYSPAETQFALWAPTAQEVRVMLYEAGQGGSAYQMIPLVAEEEGMWKGTVEEDLNGKFYTFNVKIKDVWQGDTPGLMAKAVGVNGDRAAILDLKSTDPQLSLIHI